MASFQDDMDSLHVLLKSAVHSFYADTCIIIVELLLKNFVLSDIELSKLTYTTPKEVQKTIGKLKKEGVVGIEERMIGGVNLVTGQKTRPIPRQYYYVDWYTFLNGLKYRLYKLSKLYDDKMKVNNWFDFIRKKLQIKVTCVLRVIQNILYCKLFP